MMMGMNKYRVPSSRYAGGYLIFCVCHELLCALVDSRVFFLVQKTIFPLFV